MNSSILTAVLHMNNFPSPVKDDQMGVYPDESERQHVDSSNFDGPQLPYNSMAWLREGQGRANFTSSSTFNEMTMNNRTNQGRFFQNPLRGDDSIPNQMRSYLQQQSDSHEQSMKSQLSATAYGSLPFAAGVASNAVLQHNMTRHSIGQNNFLNTNLSNTSRTTLHQHSSTNHPEVHLQSAGLRSSIAEQSYSIGGAANSLSSLSSNGGPSSILNQFDNQMAISSSIGYRGGNTNIRDMGRMFNEQDLPKDDIMSQLFLASRKSPKNQHFATGRSISSDTYQVQQFHNNLEESQAFSQQKLIGDNFAGTRATGDVQLHPYSFLFRDSITSNNKRLRDEEIHSSLQSHDNTNRQGKSKKSKVAADTPRRPLTAYNFFFSEEREIILAQLPNPEKDKRRSSSNLSCQPENTPAASESSCVNEDNASDAACPPQTLGGQDSSRTETELQRIKESMRTLPPAEMEELITKIKENTERILKTEIEGDRVKKSHRKMHGKIPFQMLAKIVGQRWRSLDTEKKAYYEGVARRDMARYDSKMKEYDRKKNTPGVNF